MKKLIAIAAIVIASVTTAQVKAQTAEERIIVSIDTFMKAQHPEYAKIERYKVLGINNAGEPIFSGEIPLAFQAVKIPADLPLEYKDNAEKLYGQFTKDINSDVNKDYEYDLYSFSVFEKDSFKYFILIQDYQVRPTLESVRKQMLEQN